LPFARLLSFPLLTYYAITLGIPLAKGSYENSNAFWQHFAFVLVLPLVLIALLLMGCWLKPRSGALQQLGR